MRNQVINSVGRQVAYGVARKQLEKGGAFDLKLGMALLKDGRVPTGAKMLALALGFAGVAVFDAFQLPLEALLAFALPVLGLGINLVSDGMEYTLGAFLLGSVLLPHVAPKQLVARLRAERDGVTVAASARGRTR